MRYLLLLALSGCTSLGTTDTNSEQVTIYVMPVATGGCEVRVGGHGQTITKATSLTIDPED